MHQNWQDAIFVLQRSSVRRSSRAGEFSIVLLARWVGSVSVLLYWFVVFRGVCPLLRVRRQSASLCLGNLRGFGTTQHNTTHSDRCRHIQLGIWIWAGGRCLSPPGYR
ncbi:hypothetical protein DL95DRAFT_75310 [Leptodontidium sp. 2 PMI_412]|nr:hypothetical protein DL95DRAFT_75310 [Leptodontidium sp. 2 PMI_412]